TLKRAHDIRPEQVSEVTVGVNAIVPRILIHSNPHTGLEAKFSGEFSAAAALVEPRVGISTFSDEKLEDPSIRAVMGRVKLVGDPDIPGDQERHMWTRVTLRLTDGRTVSVGPREVPGHPANPLTAEALEEKFQECARLVLSADRVDTVAQMLDGLETCPDVRSLTAILGPA